jgi:D-galactarolactone cycloisomerase
VPCWTAEATRVVDDITETPFQLDTDSYLTIPERPALGVSLDRDKLLRYTPDPSPLFAA